MPAMTEGHWFGLKMESRGAGSVIFMASLCLLFMTSCAWKKGIGLDGAGPVTSRAVLVSRTVLEPVRNFAAAPSRSVTVSQELWTAPAFSRLDGHPRTPDVCDGELAVQGWLPPEETETMQRFVRNLHGKKGPSAFLLNRIRKYLPMIMDVFERYRLPRELAFLPVVESRFETHAVSAAGAAGLWQIMPDTALRFGLMISESEDERFDARKSTCAAAAYLAALHQRFKDWPLALAAYNCGEGALSRALMRTGAETLSELTAICRMERSASGVLARETLEYVPKFVGAVRVMSGLTDISGTRFGSGDARGGTRDDHFSGGLRVFMHHEQEVALQGESTMAGRGMQ